MPIPKHYEIRIPVLNYLKTHGTADSKQMVAPLASHFGLSGEEISQMYPSGNGPVFKDRISWAITYLLGAGLISRVSRGQYEINAKGLEMLQKPGEIDAYIEKHYITKWQLKTETKSNAPQLPEQGSTPQEELYASYADIKKSTCEEILDTIISKSPYEFEKLVVQLLQKMGYGGEIKDSGLVTKATNDEGIDGIIKEDVLGFGRIYIQAKKYNRQNPVNRIEIQKFVGALAAVKSNKGVFITTSYYNKGAIDYAKSLNQTSPLVLINGEELANYIYDYGLGMQVEQTITLKRLDGDFWDAMEDDKNMTK